MKTFFPICLFLFLSCAGAKEDKNEVETANITDDDVYTAKFDSLSGAELEKLFAIDIKHKFNEKYSGRYSYKFNKTGDKILHDEFLLFHLDSGNLINSASKEVISDMISILKVKYSGQFRDGKKIGKFTEDFLSDDGVDLYSKWTISIDFNDDKCESATFNGVIGTAMPKTTYNFKSLKLCSFDNVMKLAEKEWAKEFEKRKNSH